MSGEASTDPTASRTQAQESDEEESSYESSSGETFSGSEESEYETESSEDSVDSTKAPSRKQPLQSDTLSGDSASHIAPKSKKKIVESDAKAHSKSAGKTQGESAQIHGKSAESRVFATGDEVGSDSVSVSDSDASKVSESESGTGTDSDDSDLDSDSESESESETEPQLKYQRLGGDVSSTILSGGGQKATCLRVHTKLLVLGTDSGHVYILDPRGDRIRASASVGAGMKDYRPHHVAVEHLCIDDGGEFIASCARDGRVVIRDIYKDTHTVHSFQKQKLLAVALHPRFGEKKVFVTGGMSEELLLRSIGYFRSDTNVVHSGEGPIYAIEWRNEIIAWANDHTIKLYDVASSQPLAQIQRNMKGAPNPALYRCCLCWEDDRTLLIGWGDWVKIARLGDRRTVDGHWQKDVTVTDVFITDYIICGIAPFGEHLVLLAYVDDGDDDDDSDDVAEDGYSVSEAYVSDGSGYEYDDTKSGGGSHAVAKGRRKAAGSRRKGGGRRKAKNANPPEFKLVTRKGQWVASDALPMKNFEHMCAKDYACVWLNDAPSVRSRRKPKAGASAAATLSDKESTLKMSQFYIVSGEDILVALPRTAEDHIEWLLQQNKLEIAWKDSVRYEDDLSEHLSPRVLGNRFLTHLLIHGSEEERNARFGTLCQQICGEDIGLWEYWVYRLKNFGSISGDLDVSGDGSSVALEERFGDEHLTVDSILRQIATESSAGGLLAADGKNSRLHLIVECVPTIGTVLSPNAYKEILFELLDRSHQTFLDKIKKWPQDIYDANAILEQAAFTLDTVKSNTLVQAVAELHKMSGDFERALEYYLQLSVELFLAAPSHFDLVSMLLSTKKKTQKRKGKMEKKKKKKKVGESGISGEKEEESCDSSESDSISSLVKQIRVDGSTMDDPLEALTLKFRALTGTIAKDNNSLEAWLLQTRMQEFRLREAKRVKEKTAAAVVAAASGSSTLDTLSEDADYDLGNALDFLLIAPATDSGTHLSGALIYGDHSGVSEMERKRAQSEERKALVELSKIQVGIFEMIDAYELYATDTIQRRILSLVELDLLNSVRLFAEKREFFSLSDVVSAVKSKLANIEAASASTIATGVSSPLPMASSKTVAAVDSLFDSAATRISPQQYSNYLRFFLYLYLHKVVGSSDGTKFPQEINNLLVALYSEFNAAQLHRFMEMASNSVNFPLALTVCHKRVSVLMMIRQKEAERCKKLSRKLLYSSKSTSPPAASSGGAAKKGKGKRKGSLTVTPSQISRVRLRNAEVYSDYGRLLNHCIVFVLNRMGNYNEALQTYLTQLKDMTAAVRYVEQRNDDSMWTRLIDSTLFDAEELVPKLLDALKSHPQEFCKDLIEKIPPKLHIDDLRRRILAIFEEYSRKKSLVNGTTNILRSDCQGLAVRLVTQSRRGAVLCDSQLSAECYNCVVCGIPLTAVSSLYHSGLFDETMTLKSQEFGGSPTPPRDSSESEAKREAHTLVVAGGLYEVALERKQPKDGADLSDQPLYKLWSLAQKKPPLIGFFCGHTFHLECFREACISHGIYAEDQCVRCFPKPLSASKRRR